MTPANEAGAPRSRVIFSAPNHHRVTLSPTARNNSPSRSLIAGYWVFTALFCLQIGFTAYAQLRLPQVAQMFAHLGFPDYFRVELSWAKLIGVVLLVAPASVRLKEWAYAGFAITLVSALIAHFSLGDGPEVWGWAAGTCVLLALSYVFWLRLQSIAAGTPSNVGGAER